MTSKEALSDLFFLAIGDEKHTKKCKETIEQDLEILKILKRKGVAIGFIQLLIKEKAGGVNEYNEFIGGDKKLYLSEKEFNKIKDWLENE